MMGHGVHHLLVLDGERLAGILSSHDFMVLQGTSPLVIAREIEGRSTVEGLASDGELSTLQQSFHEHHALQCGYCTPGMLMSATALQGNICRCTGYVNIVEAVVAAGKKA